VKLGTDSREEIHGEAESFLEWIGKYATLSSTVKGDWPFRQTLRVAAPAGRGICFRGCDVPTSQNRGVGHPGLIQGALRTGGRASRIGDSGSRPSRWSGLPTVSSVAVAHFILDGFGQFFDFVGFFDDRDGELVLGGFGHFVVEFLGEIEEMRGV
jgi:hypothetical protein